MPTRSAGTFWKFVNPVVRPLAGYAPWWVLLETTGCRTGTKRFTPLAGAPFDGNTVSVVSVYGDQSGFVRNVLANPAVRVRRRGRWLTGRAAVVAPTPETVTGLGMYARHVLLRIGDAPKIVRVTVDGHRP